MSKCTAEAAVEAMLYWENYYEKASSAYAQTRAKSAFGQNKGSGNFTYAGYLCGVQGQPWCAAQDSTAIYEACGSDKDSAKAVLYGVWPYVACNQVWDAAPDDMKIWSYHQRFKLGKGDRVNRKPVIGDIIVFTDNCKSRDHTGMVYAVDNTYVYTIEGNSSNMCRKRSYLLTSSYIYGWIHPAYAPSETSATVATPIEQYGALCCKDPQLHVLSKGTAGPEVLTIQRLIVASKIVPDLEIDGDFGKKTEAAVKLAQEKVGLTGDNIDGKVGKLTWPLMLKKLA